ncbi:MAG TPA: alpha/beta family hydrolase [Blastocatellia bacterium]|nr:alpha/beta family hydrolase [Blastocatellia bacterium]
MVIECWGEVLDMSPEAIEIKFIATPEKGKVSALLVWPPGARFLLVLGHGASTNMRHSTLKTISERLADEAIATLRYNFPYMEPGGGGRSQPVCVATVRSAVAAAHKTAPDLKLLAGGHSFGGRMTSTAYSEAPLDHVRGLVFFSFPLHQPGKPETRRADHLGAVSLPMLFLNGTTAGQSSLPADLHKSPGHRDIGPLYSRSNVAVLQIARYSFP